MQLTHEVNSELFFFFSFLENVKKNVNYKG